MNSYFENKIKNLGPDIENKINNYVFELEISNIINDVKKRTGKKLDFYNRKNEHKNMKVCINLIKNNLDKMKTISNRFFCGGLKHDFEGLLPNHYITSENFVICMIISGFKYKFNGYNFYFNITKKSMKRFYKNFKIY